MGNSLVDIGKKLPLGVKLAVMLVVSAVAAAGVADHFFTLRMRRELSDRISYALERDGRRQELRFLLFCRHLVDMAEHVEQEEGLPGSLASGPGCDQSPDRAFNALAASLVAVFVLDRDGRSPPRPLFTRQGAGLPPDFPFAAMSAWLNRGPRPVLVGGRPLLCFKVSGHDGREYLLAAGIGRGLLKLASASGGNRHMALVTPDGRVVVATASGCRTGRRVDEERYRSRVLRRYRPPMAGGALDLVAVRSVLGWRREAQARISRARRERLFTAAAVILPAFLLILTAGFRLRRLAVEVGRFQERALATPPRRGGGDEIFCLERMFADLAREVERSHRTIREQAREENRVVVENALDAIITFDRDGRVTGWNPAAALVFGWQKHEVAGRMVAETIFSGSARVAFEKELAWFRDKGRGITLDRICERVARHRDGHGIPVEMFVTAVTLESGPGFVAFFRDSTSIKARERKIANANHLQGVFNAILRINLERVSLERQLRMALEQILTVRDLGLAGRGAIFLVEEEPDELVMAVQQGLSRERVAACGRVRLGRCFCGRAAAARRVSFFDSEEAGHEPAVDGSGEHGHYCVPIVAGGSLLGLLLLHVDPDHVFTGAESRTLAALARLLAGVIERRMIEEHLDLLIDSLKHSVREAERERRFSDSVVSGLDSGIAVLDRRDRVIRVNPAGREIIGMFFDGDPVGMEISALFGPGVAAVADMEAGSRVEVNAVTPSGDGRLLRLGRTPLSSGTGSSIFVFQDITVEHSLRQEMEKMNRLATVAEIASAVAHEVRNPLAGIKTMGQAIEERMAADDPNREYVTRIVRQVDRINHLLTEFFTYARPPEPQRRDVDLAEVVADTLQLVAARMRRHRIEVEVDIAPRTTVRADPAQVQQVLLNLLLNAVQAIGDDGLVRIEAARSGPDGFPPGRTPPPGLDHGRSYVRLSVQDNGCGIPPDLRDKVFEPFFTTRHDGSGLGLAIVYRILKENGATVCVDSQPGRHTTFDIYFEEG